MLKKFTICFLLSALLLAACVPATITPEAPVTDTARPLIVIKLPMGYIPNVQFAPFYVAVERGYYRDAGLAVSFDYSFETDGVALVGASELPFALVSGEQVLLARAKELPVVYVMGWYQKFPISIISTVEKNIVTPADLRGQRIGIPGLFGASYVGLRAILKAGGLSESDVTLDTIGFNQVEALAAKQEDVVVGYAANEPIVLRSKGYAVTELRVSDYAQLASNGIITNETTILNNPDLVRAFVNATLLGLRDTIADPDAAYEISKKYVDNLKDLDPLVQKDVLGTSIELWRAPRLGYTDPVAWDNMQKTLLDMGLLTAPLDVSKAFTNEFIPQ
jgi:NitT/TauT family transport system substrate-binding protein